MNIFPADSFNPAERSSVWIIYSKKGWKKRKSFETTSSQKHGCPHIISPFPGSQPRGPKPDWRATWFLLGPTWRWFRNEEPQIKITYKTGDISCSFRIRFPKQLLDDTGKRPQLLPHGQDPDMLPPSSLRGWLYPSLSLDNWKSARKARWWLKILWLLSFWNAVSSCICL